MIALKIQYIRWASVTLSFNNRITINSVNIVSCFDNVNVNLNNFVPFFSLSFSVLYEEGTVLYSCLS